MSLANLFNIPASKTDFDVFSLSNADQHRQIIAQIAAQKGITLPEFILDPIPESGIVQWLESHQAMHTDFCAVLGIAGVDLTDVDFRDPEQASSWHRLHGREHQDAAAILGIS